MTYILTKKFWQSSWIWIKANWKFLVGLSIPIIVYIISRKGNINNILKQAVDQRDQVIRAERRAAGLENQQINDIHETHVKEIKEIEAEHERQTQSLQEKRQKWLDEVSSAAEATDELANQFNLDNLDENN